MPAEVKSTNKPLVSEQFSQHSSVVVFVKGPFGGPHVNKEVG